MSNRFWSSSLFVIFLLLVEKPPMLFAEVLIGNGGDIVLCEAKEPQLLDFYNARRVLNLKPTMGSSSLLKFDSSLPNLSELKEVLPIVEFWLEGLRALSPERAIKYLELLQKFPIEWRLVEDQPFPNIDDHGDVLIGEGCRVEQIAIQKKPHTSLDGRYFVSADLWKLISDPIEKAGLILHEIVYRDAIERGHPNSYFVRRYTAFLADRVAMDSMSAEKFRDLLHELRFSVVFDINPKEPVKLSAFLFPEESVTSDEAAHQRCKELLGERAGLGILDHSIPSSDTHIFRFLKKFPIAFWHSLGNGKGQIRGESTDGSAAILCAGPYIEPG